ncbi:ABC transporter substrate-binding protein [Paenibacillus xylanivorans]|uniref:ABC transporter substrate-binding protein n=1 Tax=Paenibacillus xylanivorans TaxID=1705561 RepID=A0A0M9BQ94_9BACL|nr:ABC transporter substrate-binding protein [Paenibacillus xylanivorans]KOY15922.1 ABC transporter substrate-binding protein [Paenibacillus xylanivorans]
MKTRKIALLMAALMLAFATMLAGCGGSNTNDTSGNTASGGESGDKDPVKLKVYLIGGPQRDLPIVQDEMNKYLMEKINTTVDITMIDWGDYSKRMPVITASGENYDIAFTSSWAYDYLPNATRGAFLPINDLLDKYGQGIKEQLDPRFLTGSQIGGQNYAVPVNKELASQWVWRFNKQYVDKYNMDITKIRTLEDLEPYLQQIKDNEPADITPLAVPKGFKPYLAFDFLLGDEFPVGINMDGDTGKYVNVLESEELKSSLKTIRKYYQAGYLRKDVATLEGIDNIKTGKWFVDREQTQPYAELGWSRSAGYDIVTTPMQDPVIFTGSATGAMHAISANSKNPERAMMFLNLLNTDPYLRNLINYGIEGTHYKKISDNVIEDLPAMKDGFQMPGFALGNLFLTYMHKEDPADKWEAFKEFNNSAKVAPSFGFNFNPDPVKTEVASISAIVKEFYPSIMTGAVDPDEHLPKAIEKLKAAGLDKVIAEAQKQYDEWQAANPK